MNNELYKIYKESKKELVTESKKPNVIAFLEGGYDIWDYKIFMNGAFGYPPRISLTMETTEQLFPANKVIKLVALNSFYRSTTN